MSTDHRCARGEARGQFRAEGAAGKDVQVGTAACLECIEGGGSQIGAVRLQAHRLCVAGRGRSDVVVQVSQGAEQDGDRLQGDVALDTEAVAQEGAERVRPAPGAWPAAFEHGRDAQCRTVAGAPGARAGGLRTARAPAPRASCRGRPRLPCRGRSTRRAGEPDAPAAPSRPRRRRPDPRPAVEHRPIACREPLSSVGTRSIETTACQRPVRRAERRCARSGPSSRSTSRAARRRPGRRP